MKEPRIAIFDKVLTFNVADVEEPAEDSPSKWAYRFEPANWESRKGLGDEVLWRVSDRRTSEEVLRLMRFGTCPFCRTLMCELEPEHEDGRIRLCVDCGYWGGRGTREEGHVKDGRGALGRYRLLEPLDENSTELLKFHLRRSPSDLTKISPKRAESFIADIIADVLKCETRLVGGTKDHGVDAYIVRGDKLRTIIQVKWHKSSSKAESVSVVREVTGTLVARGVPRGIIVSTRSHFSEAAIKEAEEVAKRKVRGVGALKLELLDYHNILDMLELANSKLKDLSPKDRVPKGKDFFEGIYYQRPEAL